MGRTIYVLGNSLVKVDNMPLKILTILQKAFPEIEFIHLDPTEEYTEESVNPIFLDTVVGIDSVTIFHDLDSFSPPQSVSVHDFDLYVSLKLLMKLGKVKRVKIIGVPDGITKEKAIRQVIEILESRK